MEFARYRFLSSYLEDSNFYRAIYKLETAFRGICKLGTSYHAIFLVVVSYCAISGKLKISWKLEIEICKVAVFHRVISTIGASDHEVCKGLRKSETWDLGTRCRTQRLKLCPRTRKYSSYCHIQTIILGLVHCVEHKAGIIFQKETLFGQSLAFKLITFKKTTAKLIPYNMKIA